MPPPVAPAEKALARNPLARQMNDCFALLKEPRRPWLDTESLKAKFFLLSAAFHPDKVHGGTQDEKSAAQQRYSELNAAYNRLRDPKERLLHLLELERGEKPKDTQRIAPSLAETFNQVNLICRAADALRSEAHRITSPLLKVAMFDRAQEMTEKLLQLQQKIQVQRTPATEPTASEEMREPGCSGPVSASTALNISYALDQCSSNCCS